MNRHARTSRGFTIVELLIVVVIIAILAAITIVAYNGIQRRARASAASSSLAQAQKKLELYKVDNSTYPITANLSAAGITDSNDTTYQYTSDGTTYCLTATNVTVSYYLNSTTTPTPTAGGCPGHGVGGAAAITNLVTNPSFESGVNIWAVANLTKSTSTTWSNNGTSSMLLAPNGVNTDSYAQLGGYDNATFALLPSTQYTLSAYLKIAAPGTGTPGGNGSRQVTIFIHTSTGYVVYRGNQIANNIGETGRSSITFTTPSALDQAFIRLYSGYTDGSILWDSVMLTQGSTLYNYADGSSANWVWNGTANASTSTGPAL